MDNEIILKIDNNADLDRIVTFISEKCRQEHIRYDIKYSINDISTVAKNQRKIFNKPIEIGEKIAIKILTPRTRRFGFDEYNSDRIIVTLEPKNSFGDGTHETSVLSIEAIEKHIKPDSTVLDIGCGSGILSIISLVLGAKSATGIDISNIAVKNAVHNAELNNVSDKFTGINGDLTDKVSGKFDLIVANILSDQIKQLLHGIRKYMNDDTVLILSGIVDFRRDEVLAIAREHFDILNIRDKNNWICLELKLK